jgi:hypothetical protein
MTAIDREALLTALRDLRGHYANRGGDYLWRQQVLDHITAAPPAPLDIYIVHAVPEDHRGNGIWGMFSSYENAEAALTAAGLRVWDPIAHNADMPEIETPREPDERVIEILQVDYRLTSEADR